MNTKFKWILNPNLKIHKIDIKLRIFNISVKRSITCLWLYIIQYIISLSATPCPNGPKDGSSDIKQTWQPGDPTVYNTVTTYSCVDFRKMLEVPGLSEPVEYHSSKCVWATYWDNDHLVDSITCRGKGILLENRWLVYLLMGNWNWN